MTMAMTMAMMMVMVMVGVSVRVLYIGWVSYMATWRVFS